MTVLRKCLPNEPVPPVTSTDLSFKSIQGWEKSRKVEIIGATPGLGGTDSASARTEGLMGGFFLFFASVWPIVINNWLGKSFESRESGLIGC
jgi:hypothetical protein